MTHPLLLSLVPAVLACAVTAQDPVRDVAQTTEPASPDLVATKDGRLEADAGHYRAVFDSHGATLRVPDPCDAGSVLDLSLRLTDWGRGNARTTIRDHVCDRGGPEVARFRHAGIEERYRSDAVGIEQSFFITERPAGVGDLVLGITATSNTLQARAVEAAYQPLTFQHDGVGKIRYGEAIAFERGGKPVEILTRYDGRGRIELVVPAAFVDAARFPIIVDPAVGPVQNPGGPSYNDSAPDIAFDPGADYYIAVWQREFSNGDTAIRGQRYIDDGTPIGPVITITSPFNTGTNRVDKPSIAPIPSDSFLVVYELGGAIAAVRVSNGGVVYTTSNVVTHSIATNSNPVVGASMDGAFVVAERTLPGNTDPTEIVLRYVDVTSGSPIVGPEVVVESVSPPGRVHNPDLPQQLLQTSVFASTTSVTRLVWERFYSSPAPGDTDIRTAVVRYAGGLNVLSGPSTLAGGGSIGPNERSPSIACNAPGGLLNPTDEVFLIAWDEEEDIKAHRYDLLTPLGSEIDIAVTGDVEVGPAVGAGSCEFTVGYMEATPPNEFSFDVRAARVLRDGTVETSAQPIDTPNGPFQDQLRVASYWLTSAPSNWYARNLTVFAWRGLVGPGATPSNVMLRRFENVVASHYPFGSPCPGPLGELPMISFLDDPFPGNPFFDVEVNGSPTNSLAALLVSSSFATTPIPGAPGCSLYLGLPMITAFPVITDGNGSAQVNVPIPCGVPSGASLAFQWAVATPGHNAFGWIVSDDRDVYWSH